MLKTPFSANVKRPTNVGTKVVIAATLIGQIKPRARSIHCFTLREIGNLGLAWRRVQATKVGLGVVATHRMQDAFLQIEKKWRVSYRETARAASIAREVGRQLASHRQRISGGVGICRSTWHGGMSVRF